MSEAEHTKMIDIVQVLENLSNYDRGRYVMYLLDQMGIKPQIQQRQRPRINNIIVDFAADPKAKRIVFSAHYDGINGPPAANDNASGVSVLLNLCYQLRNTAAPIRIIFFDREETWLRTPVFKPGLLGSLYYVFTHSMRRIKAVYNIEFCGQGDFLSVWPVRKKDTSLPILREIKYAANLLGLPFTTVDLPQWLFSGDHLSFRLRGMQNAVTLSLLPLNQVSTIVSALKDISLWRLLIAGRPRLPEPLSYIHTDQDTSSRINEESLEIMLNLLLKLAQNA